VKVDGIGTEVPGIRGVPTELQSKDSFELSDLLMSDEFGVVHTEVGVVIGV
jgi:hypothetical protein